MAGPPVAPRRPHVRRVHGDEAPDPWAWLRDRDDPEVIAHLESENAHTAASTAHLNDLREQLFAELKGRVQETDDTAAFPYAGWWWWSHTDEGLEYASHLRGPVERDPAAGGTV